MKKLIFFIIFITSSFYLIKCDVNPGIQNVSNDFKQLIDKAFKNINGITNSRSKWSAEIITIQV